MSWFRVHDELLDDPKVQRLPGDLFKALLNLWCLASRHDGFLPSISDVAFALRITDKRAAETIEELSAVGLIDELDGRFTPHNWSKRQYKTDVSTERVKQFRERKMKRNETVSPNVAETPNETVSPRSMKLNSSVSVSVLTSLATTLGSKEDSEEKACGREFLEFWRVYPNKVGKKDAERKYQIARKTASFQTIMAALAVYIRKTDDRPWCNPGTWLNQGRWDDEPAQPVHGGALGVLERIQGELESGADSEAGEGAFVSLPARQTG